MHAVTAKVVMAGNSKALRLPRSLEVKMKSYRITPMGSGFIVTNSVAETKRLKALQALRGSAPDFPVHAG